MKAYVFLFAFLFGGLMMKAQSSTPAVSQNLPNSQALNDSKGFASPGCVELGGNINLGSQSMSPIAFLFSPFIGWFPSKGFELGLEPLSLSPVNRSMSLSALFAPAYNFQASSTIFPFIEGDMGSYLGNIGGPTAELTVGARTGVKLEIVKHGMLNFSVQYLRYNQISHETNQSAGSLFVGVGFTVSL